MSLLRASEIKIPQALAKQLFSKKWVVYAKRPFAEPQTVLEYLGRFFLKRSGGIELFMAQIPLVVPENDSICDWICAAKRI